MSANEDEIKKASKREKYRGEHKKLADIELGIRIKETGEVQK